MQTAAALTPELMNTVRKAQIDEETGAILYAYMAKRERTPKTGGCWSRWRGTRPCTPPCGKM